MKIEYVKIGHVNYLQMKWLYKKNQWEKGSTDGFNLQIDNSKNLSNERKNVNKSQIIVC
jgi:nucleoside-specific outer membrane channel protein Tsx